MSPSKVCPQWHELMARRVLHFSAFVATGNFPCVIGDISCYNSEYSMYTTLACTATIERLRAALLNILPHYIVPPSPYTTHHTTLLHVPTTTCTPVLYYLQ